MIIIGGGPAGIAAGVYAARKKLRTLFLTYSFENQSTVSLDIQNWIGTTSISGAELSKNLEAHLRAYAEKSLDIKTGEKVMSVEKSADGFVVKTDKGTFEGKTVLITSGSVRRKLDAKGADTFEHKGLTYCASCDGPLFAEQNVAVIGGGNAAFETAAQLTAYCTTIYIINRSEIFRADEITVEKVSAKPNVKIIKNAVPLEVKGDKFVTGFVYKDAVSGEEKEISVTGIFVEIGLLPNTDFVNILEKNKIGQIIVDAKTQRASLAGIWGAGDCTDGLYHQNNIAAGDAVKALEDIYLYIHAK